MKQVWVIDPDEEMNRAVGLMLKLLNCEVAAFYTVRAADIIIGRVWPAAVGEADFETPL